MDDDDRRGGFLRLERGRANPHPNIVYIISDDQGWKDIGPNGDTLAQGGARLVQFYAQPMCTLTVAAVMTGRYPFRYGLQIAIPSARPYRLPTNEWLLPQALKEAAYEAVLTPGVRSLVSLAVMAVDVVQREPIQGAGGIANKLRGDAYSAPSSTDSRDRATPG